LGERLFLETRFAEYFARHSAGDINPASGARPRDASLARIPRWDGTWIEGPLRQGTMSCAGCHLVDQADLIEGGGPRSYTDFGQRSSIPARSDGQLFTPRNSPTLVDILIEEDRQGRSLTHFDGEFGSIQELVTTGLTGRNMGWLPAEHAQAVRHIGRVIREDSGDIGNEDPIYARSYWEWYQSGLTERTSRRARTRVTDSELLGWIGDLMGEYMRSLQFRKDEAGLYSGSPYDAFLRVNGLPQKPEAGESALSYSKRLAARLEGLKQPQWVGLDGDIQNPPTQMERHSQVFRFGPSEFEGMRIFFRT
jgi:hypothetical protein